MRTPNFVEEWTEKSETIFKMEIQYWSTQIHVRYGYHFLFKRTAFINDLTMSLYRTGRIV